MNSTDYTVDFNTIDNILKKYLTNLIGFDKNNSLNTRNIVFADKLEDNAIILQNICEVMQSTLNVTMAYADVCINKAVEIRDISYYSNIYDSKISDKPNNSNKSKKQKYNKKFLKMNYVFSLMHKNESWSDISEKEFSAEYIENKIKSYIHNKKLSYNSLPETSKPYRYKEINSIDNVPLPNSLYLPIINKLNIIPHSMYWYNGDNTYPAGVYIKIINKYIKIPLMNVTNLIHYNDLNNKERVKENRKQSIKCPYSNLQDCGVNKQSTNCMYAHTGDKYLRVGTQFRCPSVPGFGNYKSLSCDLNKINSNDINIILMNALNDILLSAMWFQKKMPSSDNIITDIEICN
jgi:hypothetical protein